MGACASRPHKSGGGRTLSSSSSTNHPSNAPSANASATTQEERERRAEAAEQRLHAAQVRGTGGGKSGPGALGRKLAAEQASGGTGAHGGAGGVTRGQESEIRRVSTSSVRGKARGEKYTCVLTFCLVSMRCSGID